MNHIVQGVCVQMSTECISQTDVKLLALLT